MKSLFAVFFLVPLFLTLLFVLLLSLLCPVASYAKGNDQVKVQFEVLLPRDTPKGDIYISGNCPTLGNWDPHKVKMTRKDRNCTIELPFLPGTQLEFKFTRGSWESVEKSVNGQPIANRTLAVASDGQKVQKYYDKIGSWSDLVAAAGGRVKGATLTGTFQYHENFKTPGLKDRTIIVYLPTDYGINSDKRYPVLYMHDGNNIFDARTSFADEWEVDETIEKLVSQGKMQDIIVVGIYNTSDRIDEYTPCPDSSHGGGKAQIYADFIVNTLKPFIDTTYRTLPDRVHTGIMGSSLGGLVSLYIGQHYPEVFGLIGAMSPSIWWSNLQIVGSFETFLQGTLQKPRIWLDCGTNEEQSDRDGDGINDMLDDTRTMHTMLLRNGYVEGANLGYFEAPNAGHSEIAWSERVWRPLLFFFGIFQEKSK